MIKHLYFCKSHRQYRKTDCNKSLGPDSIPTKILKLLENIFSQLSEIFTMYFSSVDFLSILKTSKVIPVHKKDSKVDYNRI